MSRFYVTYMLCFALAFLAADLLLLGVWHEGIRVWNGWFWLARYPLAFLLILVLGRALRLPQALENARHSGKIQVTVPLDESAAGGDPA